MCRDRAAQRPLGYQRKAKIAGAAAQPDRDTRPLLQGYAALFKPLLTTKRRLGRSPEGVGCQVAALRSAAQKRPGRPGMHSSKCQCSRSRSPRKAKAAAFSCGSWSIADMNGQQSLSSCFVPGRYKMTGKSCFHLAREHLTTPIFSENVCTPKSNGRMN
ncbi:hypothetical protein D3C79_843470 [compost metagenome]